MSNLDKVVEALKHLPGQHDQKAHAGGKGGGAKQSGSKKETFDSEYGKHKMERDLIDPPEVKVRGDVVEVGLYLEGEGKDYNSLQELVAHVAAREMSKKTGEIIDPLEFAVDMEDPFEVDDSTSITATAERAFKLP